MNELKKEMIATNVADVLTYMTNKGYAKETVVSAMSELCTSLERKNKTPQTN